MIKISKENLYSFVASINDIDNKEKVTQEFWDKIELENEDLLEFILGFVESIPSDQDRTWFLDGLWMMYSLIERENELEELENLKV